MNVNTIRLAAEIRQIVDKFTAPVTADERNTYIAAALGRTIAINLPLPAGPVISISSFYGQTHDQTVVNLLAQLNEIMVIDTDAALRMCFAYYKLRYDISYDENVNVALLTSGLLISAANEVLDFFPKNVVAVMAKENEAKVDSATLHEMWKSVTYAFRRAEEAAQGPAINVG